MSEKVKEEIKYYTEWLRFAVIIVVSLVGFEINVIFLADNKYSHKRLLSVSTIFLIFVGIIMIVKIFLIKL